MGWGILSYDSWNWLHYPDCCVHFFVCVRKGQASMRDSPIAINNKEKKLVQQWSALVMWAGQKGSDWLIHIFQDVMASCWNRLFSSVLPSVSFLSSPVCCLHFSHHLHHLSSACEPSWHNWNPLYLLFPFCLQNFRGLLLLLNHAHKLSMALFELYLRLIGKAH